MNEYDFFYWIRSYCDLGYDVTLTQLHGKEAIRMVKRYSFKRGDSITCEQIIEHDNFKSEERLQKILQFCYDDIQRQEETKDYYEPFNN